MIDNQLLASLEIRARDMRYHVLSMMRADKPHHFGGSLSAVELMTALYFYALRYDPGDPSWEGRDRFVLSKGHAVPVQYAALAMLGVIPMAELSSLKELGSSLQGHPNARTTPGVEACTGSLGQGLSFANGIAMAARIRRLDIRVYVLLGDGELQEGQVWEAALGASTHKIDSLVALVDRNRLKSQGLVDVAKRLEPLAEKWQAFGWHVITVDGHNIGQICDALDEAKTVTGKPTVIIANTIKGKGVSFMEGEFQYHNAPLTRIQWEEAMRQVRGEREVAQ